MVDSEAEREGSEMVGWADDNCCASSCARRLAEEEIEEIEEEVGGCFGDGRSGRGGGRCYRSKSYSAVLHQSPLPMATTPPLSPEHLERGEARRRASFSRSNTWDRLASAGSYAISLWKLSQEMIEEKAKVFTDGPVGKLKVL